MKSILRPAILVCAMVVFLNWQNHTALSTEETNKKAYFEIVKAFESGNLDELDKYMMDNVQDHKDPLPGVTSSGLQRFKDNFNLVKTAFPDLKIIFHHVAVDGNLLFAHGSWTGTNTGLIMGNPPTGKYISHIEFVDIYRFEDGKAAEHWSVAEDMKIIQQMGFTSKLGEAPDPIEQPTYNSNAEVPVNAEMEQKMKTSYQAVLKLIESGELGKLKEHLAGNFKEHTIIPNVTLPSGIEGAKQAMTLLKKTYPDVKFTVNQLAVEGDILIAHFTMTGTFSGATSGIPEASKGKEVEIDGVDIVQFNAEGKAIAHWDVTDHYLELQQLGVITREKEKESE